jgi:ribosomal protein S12
VVKAIFFTKKSVIAYIPGYSHSLMKFSKVLISGGGARDLPVVNFTCIRGKYDFAGLFGKKRRRSIYGLKLSLDLKTFVRRKLRKFQIICFHIFLKVILIIF